MSLFGQIKSFFQQLIKYITRSFMDSIEDITSETGLKEKNLENFLAEKGISEFLKYRDYNEEEGKDYGIYTMSDFSRAVIFRITPPAFVSEKTESRLSDLFSSISIDGAVVQFLTFASRNIEKHLQAYEKYHTTKTINVDNPEMFTGLIYKRISELRRWTSESMAQGFDYRIKDFHNLCTIIFPSDIPVEDIYKHCDEISTLLMDFYPKNYNADSLLTILSEMFYFDKNPDYWDSVYDDKMEMNQQIVSQGLKVTTKKDFNGFKSNDKTLYRVLTTKAFPKDLSLFDYNNAFFDKMGNSTKIPISTSFLVSLTLEFDNVKKRKEKALDKLNHDIGELSKLKPLDFKKRPDLKERLKETENSIYLLREENEVPVPGMWTLTIMDSNEKSLNEQTAAIKQRLGELGWEIVEEAQNNIALMTFLASLPGMFSKVIRDNSRRFRILFKSNHASMAPILGDSLGAGDYNLLSIGRSGQIQRFDPFAKGAALNPNIVKAGGSGSGKSFSEAEFQSSSVSAGYLVRVVDAGGSYETLCKAGGGQYIEFEENVNLSLNPFTKARTVILEDGTLGLHQEEVISITSIFGLMGGVNLALEFRSGADVENTVNIGVFTETIIKAINIAFARGQKSTKPEDVRDVILEISREYKNEGREIWQSLENFSGALYRFCDENGPFSKYFNPPNNVNFQKSYVVIETQSLLNISNDLFVVVVSLLTNQIKNEFFDPNNIDVRKILTVDEAAPILQNPISLELLIQIYRKIRKYNGLANTITQTMKDFFRNENVSLLYEIAGWKWFLKQDEGTIGELYNEGRLPITRFEKRLLESVKNSPPNYGEYYIASENVSMLSRLKVDSLSYWTYTTDGKDKEKIKNIINEYGLDENKARVAMSHYYDGESMKLAIDYAKTGKVIQRDKKTLVHVIDNILEKAIKNKDLINIFSLDVKDKKTDDVLYSELLTDVYNTEGITNGDIYSLSKELVNMSEYENAVLNKLLNYVVNRKGSYSVNLSINMMRGHDVIDTVKKYFNMSEDIQDKVLFEIPLGSIDTNSDHIIEDNIKELKNLGFAIANDNLSDKDRILNVLSHGADYVKISPEIFFSREENLMSEIILSSLEKISGKKNINVIATRVETEEMYECVKSIDYINYVQGFYISNRKEEFL